MHDIGHYNVPDLTYAGTEGTDTERRVYTAWRMLSEAVTLSQADMAFVDGLRASGVEYDWTKRKIYPLYQDTGIDLSVADDADDPIAAGRAFRERARTLVRANVDYCLHGDDSTYRRLIADAHGGASGEYPDGLSPALTAFKEKYMPFFVEDFRWTAANWHDMVLRKEEFARWWEPVSALREPLNLQMLSVADCMKLAGITEENGPSMDARELVSRVLAVLDQECLSRGWLSETPLELVSTEIQLLRAFGRWLMGSLMLFARYHFLHDSPVIQTKLVDFIVRAARAARAARRARAATADAPLAAALEGRRRHAAGGRGRALAVRAVRRHAGGALARVVRRPHAVPRGVPAHQPGVRALRPGTGPVPEPRCGGRAAARAGAAHVELEERGKPP